MEFKIDKRFKDHLKAKLGTYDIEIGVLKDKPHKWPLSFRLHGLKKFAGGPARKISPKASYATLNDVSKAWRKRENYLRAPFKSKSNKDILLLLKEFLNYTMGRSTERRLINLAQAVIRNPILRGDYGVNTKQTEKRKGFNRYGIDTGQFFKSIEARILKGSHV